MVVIKIVVIVARMLRAVASVVRCFEAINDVNIFVKKSTVVEMFVVVVQVTEAVVVVLVDGVVIVVVVDVVAEPCMTPGKVFVVDELLLYVLLLPLLVLGQFLKNQMGWSLLLLALLP